MPASAIVFENVSVKLGGNLILEDVCASVPKGSCTAIVGPNGAGKTTLLLALLGKIPYKGKIILESKNGVLPRIGYVPQRLQFDRAMPLTVLEFLTIGIQQYPVCFGVSKFNRQKVQSYLEAVKADKLIDYQLGILSGGELQRVLLALALMQEPEILILDEPAAGVDFHGEIIFCEILESLRHQRCFTQLMVSHDLSTVTHHAGHVICLNRKVAAEGPPRKVLNHETLTAVFGLHMGLIAKDSISDKELECSSCKEGKR